MGPCVSCGMVSVMLFVSFSHFVLSLLVWGVMFCVPVRVVFGVVKVWYCREDDRPLQRRQGEGSHVRGERGASVGFWGTCEQSCIQGSRYHVYMPSCFHKHEQEAFEEHRSTCCTVSCMLLGIAPLDPVSDGMTCSCNSSKIVGSGETS